MDEVDLFRNFRRGVAAPSAEAQRRASALLASALEEAAGQKSAARPLQGRGRRRLVAFAAAVVVVVVGTASAFGTARGIFGTGQHVEISMFELTGRKGDLDLNLLFRSVGPRTWKVVSGTGQYARISGGGRVSRVGGRGRAHSARLVGFLTHLGAKQRVAIMIKGRPNGVFVLTPLQSGVLRRDSGTASFVGSRG